MAKVLIVYYSKSGNTKKMAELIKSGVEKEKLDVVLQDVKDTGVEDLLGADAIIMGSPVYYGTMAAPLKKLFDDSVSHHGELDGKIGAAFSSSANIGGGNETTVLDILNAMLIHGMIIQGDPQGDHYGPVSIGKPDQRVEKECLRFGQRMAQLTKRLKG
ncbi:MAG: flavodoxin family protein [Candidatus Omnitrophica bacterium]|nr:flavodoxin family protein [Candidatus Omnitrophota bacterium]MDD5352890.1 flavodoxin family protein [Candidatus Omnitrophota bacterium]MDD5550489.1 flavodoxin family protein [Candidatus Omnitrophota bacterium]